MSKEVEHARHHGHQHEETKFPKTKKLSGMNTAGLGLNELGNKIGTCP